MTQITNRIIVLCILLACSWGAMAQDASINASIDSTQMWIGQQTRIHLEVAANQDAELNLMLLEKDIMPGIEILERSEPDTTDIGNNRMRINYNYLVTSFDEDLYAIPPFKLIEQGDTMLSNELALKVVTVPVDTLNIENYFEMKDIVEPPIVWKDYANYILYPLGGLALIALLVLAYFFFIKKKPIVQLKKEEPQLPPHIIALQELDAIKSRKLWQAGRIKEYHSEITDALRAYIERRFNVNALEMTSGEILDHVKGISDIDNVYDKLKQTLQLADFVKFAKYHALPDENELSLLNAYLFVNDTKIEVIKPVEEQKKEELNENLNKK